MKILQKMKLIGLGVAAVLMLGLGSIARPAYAACDSNCDGCDGAAEQANCFANLANGGNTNTELVPQIWGIIDVVIAVIGIITVVVIVYGGVQYTISAGDASKVAKAKHTIMYGLIGLIVTLLAAAIVNFVLKSIF